MELTPLFIPSSSKNIDGLDHLAGIPEEKLVECHGHFRTASCIRCTKAANPEQVKEKIVGSGATPICDRCGGHVKPDIVFFGEELPPIFMDNIDQDMEDCDLLIVMGTSLLVAPVASIPNWVGEKVPRLLINRDLVGSFATAARRAKQHEGVQQQIISRDVFAQGDCDDGARKVCELAGEDWAKQLEEMHTESSCK